MKRKYGLEPLFELKDGTIPIEMMYPEEGHCFRVRPNPTQFPTWDHLEDPKHSLLILYEDGKPLGPAHEPLDLVRQFGFGRYAYWDGILYFSSSDNSNPLKNGRTYTIEHSTAFHSERAFHLKDGTIPAEMVYQERGHCFRFWPNPTQFPTWDDLGDPHRSCLTLYEDGKPLGPAHEPLDLVRQIGFGRYAYWDRVLYFSSSDNSNPFENGRTYTIEHSTAFHSERAFHLKDGTIPAEMVYQERGHCFRFWPNPTQFPTWDDLGDPHRSCLTLYEDGKPLGPAHEPLDLVRQIGFGRYAYWDRVLYFSSSDNSNPLENGRTYTIENSTRLDPEVAFDMKDGTMTAEMIYQERGYCFRVRPSPTQFPTWDDPSDPSHSCLILYEDGKPLGPAHEPLDLVRQIGFGRYAYWDRVLYFSSSDNSNPLENGRTYTIENSPDLYFKRQIEYCLGIIRNYVRYLNADDLVFQNHRVLEVGAGRSMGTALMMACLGAEVVVVDRYLPTWDKEFHPAFFSELKEQLPSLFPWANVQPIHQVLANQSFECDVVQTVHGRLEDLTTRFEEYFDIHVSNACLEHLEHTEAAFHALARSLKPKAFGAHQVDFRDHSNFANPLDFLLLSEKTHKENWTGNRYIHGNRMRQDQMSECLRQAGFRNFTFTTEMSADADYLEEFLPRLRAATESPFRFYPHHQLCILSGFYNFSREN